MNETLRMTVNVAAIIRFIPRESPGALVNGNYIPKGVGGLLLGITAIS